MLKWIIATILGTIIGIGVYLYNYLGGYKPVELAEIISEPLILLSKDHTGPYHKIVPIIMEVENWAKENGISCKKSFGEFLDSPESVEEGRLRSHGGCLLSKEESLKLQDKYKSKDGFKISEIASRKVLQARFEGSPGIGPMKVYPKALKYLEEKRLSLNGPVIEIYEIHEDQKAMTTYYHFPY